MARKTTLEESDRHYPKPGDRYVLFTDDGGRDIRDVVRGTLRETDIPDIWTIRDSEGGLRWVFWDHVREEWVRGGGQGPGEAVPVPSCAHSSVDALVEMLLPSNVKRLDPGDPDLSPDALDALEETLTAEAPPQPPSPPEPPELSWDVSESPE